MSPREAELSQQLAQCQADLVVAQRENAVLRQKLDALARRLFGERTAHAACLCVWVVRTS